MTLRIHRCLCTTAGPRVCLLVLSTGRLDRARPSLALAGGDSLVPGQAEPPGMPALAAAGVAEGCGGSQVVLGFHMLPGVGVGAPAASGGPCLQVPSGPLVPCRLGAAVPLASSLCPRSRLEKLQPCPGVCALLAPHCEVSTDWLTDHPPMVAMASVLEAASVLRSNRWFSRML